MATYQKFVSLIHKNSYTKFITGLGTIGLPILLAYTIGRIFLVFSPLIQDKHLVTNPFKIAIVSFFIGLLFIVATFIMGVLILNLKKITFFIVDEFFPKRNT